MVRQPKEAPSPRTQSLHRWRAEGLRHRAEALRHRTQSLRRLPVLRHHLRVSTSTRARLQVLVVVCGGTWGVKLTECLAMYEPLIIIPMVRACRTREGV